MTALDEFRALIKDHIGPDLRRLGWTGSGGNWLRPDPTQWVLLGWQKSRYSSAASVEFTANLKVIARDAWDGENVPRGRRPAKPAPSTHWGLGWEARIGALIPGTSGDRWWFVRPGDDLGAIAAEVLDTMSTYGFPAVDRELAAAATRPRSCWHNIGGRNWFEPCGRPADVELRIRDRVLYRCADHAAPADASNS